MTLTIIISVVCLLVGLALGYLLFPLHHQAEVRTDNERG